MSPPSPPPWEESLVLLASLPLVPEDVDRWSCDDNFFFELCCFLRDLVVERCMATLDNVVVVASAASADDDERGRIVVDIVVVVCCLLLVYFCLKK